jgi:hypothetical protein
MRRSLIVLALLLLGQVRKSSPADMQVGMNVDAPVYYSTCWQYRDLVRSAQYFAGHGDLYDPKKLGGQFDSAGWPKGLDPSQQFYIRCGQSIGGDPPGGTISRAANLPAGTYTLYATGKGSVQVQVFLEGGGAVTQNYPVAGPATIPVVVPTSIFPYPVIRILTSEPADYVRDVRFLMPGYKADDPLVFNDEFIAGLKPFPVLRCMNLGATNSPTVKTWADRATPTAPFTHSVEHGKGIPAEQYGELARRTGADLWICLPHTADDDYATRFGALLKSVLPAGTKVYLEYSNEVWNTLMFPQGKDLQAEALASGRYTGKDPFTSLLRYYAYKAKKAHDAFAAGFGDDSRLVRIVASQSANWYTADTELDEYVHVLGGPVPTLAVGGYIGLDFGQPDQAAATKALGVPGLLRALRDDPRGIPGMVKEFQGNKVVADRYGSPLAVYEGGLHLVGTTIGTLQDQDLTNLYAATNRDPGIKDVIAAQLKAARDAGVGVFAEFAYCDPYSMYGSWGSKEYERQADAPKYRAMVEWAAATPGPITPASPATLDLISASRASHAALEAARKAAAELEAKVLAADRAVAGDLQQNGAYVDTSTTPPTVYSADPSQPAGFRAEPVRVGPSKDTRGPQDALPPARRRARRAA